MGHNLWPITCGQVVTEYVQHHKPSENITVFESQYYSKGDIIDIDIENCGKFSSAIAADDLTQKKH